jgi:hypothetical protein
MPSISGKAAFLNREADAGHSPALTGMLPPSESRRMNAIVRRFVRYSVTLLAWVAAIAAEPTAAPVFPSEIKLSSGATLRNTSPVRWTSDSVVVKHAGGVDPVRFSSMSEASRKAVLAVRDTAKSAAQAQTSAAKTKPTVTGQVFVTTRGAGAYKFSGAQVVAYPLSIHEEVASLVRVLGPSDPNNRGVVDKWIEELGKRTSVGAATTDAEGRYSMQLSTSDPVFLFCVARRLVGRSAEINMWRVPVESKDGTADLNGDNCRTFEVETRR